MSTKNRRSRRPHRRPSPSKPPGPTRKPAQTQPPAATPTDPSIRALAGVVARLIDYVEDLEYRLTQRVEELQGDLLDLAAEAEEAADGR